MRTGQQLKDMRSLSDLRRLQYFKAIAEELNFRRAADALKVAQPALSRHIKELEQDLGLKLFERSKRRVVLTDAGAELLVGVRSMIDTFDDARHRASEAHSGRRGRLTIGAVGMVMVRHLPTVVRSFSATYPDVSIDIAIFRSADLREALRRRRVQLAFTSGFDEDATLSGEYLWTFHPRIVLPRDHPLARRATVELAELNGTTLFMHERRAYAYREVMALCSEQRFSPGTIKEVSPIADLETLIGMVACGLGVTILPSALEEIRFPTVVFKPIRTKQSYRVAACWRKDDANPLVRSFVDAAAQLKESFGRMQDRTA